MHDGSERKTLTIDAIGRDLEDAKIHSDGFHHQRRSAHIIGSSAFLLNEPAQKLTRYPAALSPPILRRPRQNVNDLQVNLSLHLLEFISENNVSFRLIRVDQPNRSWVSGIPQETNHAHQGSDPDPGRNEDQPVRMRMEEITEFSVRAVDEDVLAGPPVLNVRRKISHGLDGGGENAPLSGTRRNSKRMFLQRLVRLDGVRNMNCPGRY